MTYSLYQLLGLFLIYSFLGWCAEVCYAALTTGKVVNRGFLNGPVCPIYGVGMMGVLLLLTPVSDHVLLLFIGGMILCTLVELIGGWVLCTIFHTRWWDYSNQPFNLGGYVCLGFSVLWGLAVAFVVRLIHPAILGLVNHVPHTLGLVLMSVLSGLFLADLTVTLVTIVGIKRSLGELERVAGALHTVSDAISGTLGNTTLAADAKLDEIKESGQEKVAAGREKVSAAMTAGREKVSAAMTAGQEKVTVAVAAGQERVSAAMSASQEKAAESRQKLESKVSQTLEELQARKEKLEERQKTLLAEYRSRFGVRRLIAAFPDMKQALQNHLDNLDKE